MNEFPDVVGTVATGALLSRAVEPAHGENDGHTDETVCLNCGTPLLGPHCHACGQHAHVHRTLGAFFHDLLHGVLHFEGKLWRTLPLLAWRPSKLTREYIDGRRASYVSPIALFLFTIFVSFALWSALGGIGDVGRIDSDLVADSGQFRESLAKVDAEVAKLEAEAARSRARGTALRPGLAGELSGQRAARKAIATAIAQEGAPATGRAADGNRTASIDIRNNGNFGRWLGNAWLKAKEDPELLLYKLQSNAYKLSWLLIPLSLPFMWLLFPFSRRFRMYDHTVFVTYSISFMTFLVALSSLGAYLNFSPLVIVPLLFAPVHLYKQLRGTYGLGRLGAAWRLMILSLLIYVVLALFIVIMLGLVIS